MKNYHVTDIRQKKAGKNINFQFLKLSQIDNMCLYRIIEMQILLDF